VYQRALTKSKNHRIEVKPQKNFYALVEVSKYEDNNKFADMEPPNTSNLQNGCDKTVVKTHSKITLAGKVSTSSVIPKHHNRHYTKRDSYMGK